MDNPGKTMRSQFVLVVAISVCGCVTIPATRDGEEPARTFHASAEFHKMGECLYGKVRSFWLARNADSIPKTDLLGEVRFEQEIPLSYAVAHGWTIGVKPAPHNSSEVRVYEGQRGLNMGAELYDVELPRFIQACDN